MVWFLSTITCFSEYTWLQLTHLWIFASLFQIRFYPHSLFLPDSQGLTFRPLWHSWLCLLIAILINSIHKHPTHATNDTHHACHQWYTQLSIINVIPQRALRGWKSVPPNTLQCLYTTRSPLLLACKFCILGPTLCLRRFDSCMY